MLLKKKMLCRLTKKVQDWLTKQPLIKIKHTCWLLTLKYLTHSQRAFQGEEICSFCFFLPAPNSNSADVSCGSCRALKYVLVSHSQVLARHRLCPACCGVHQRRAGPTAYQLLGAFFSWHVHLPAVPAGAREASTDVRHWRGTFEDVIFLFMAETF